MKCDQGGTCWGSAVLLFVSAALVVLKYRLGLGGCLFFCVSLIFILASLVSVVMLTAEIKFIFQNVSNLR